jgi:two-component system chemotaxis response regulator CheY
MKQVLIVDDSPVVRKIARRILEGMGLQASEASDGGQALATCSFSMPDAIFVDSNMPVLDSYDFLRRLRHMPAGDRPKVVFCASEYDVSQIARAMHAGANDFMMKPFDRDLLQTKFMDISAH